MQKRGVEVLRSSENLYATMIVRYAWQAHAQISSFSVEQVSTPRARKESSQKQQSRAVQVLLRNPEKIAEPAQP